MSTGPFRFPGSVYPIVDVAACSSRTPLDLAEAVLAGGAKLVQLRAKQISTRDFCDLARALLVLCGSHGARLIVNDRTDIARLTDAAGVHLGQTDLPPREARRLLGADAVVGFSTHNLQQVKDAEALGCVDYLGFGPIFPTTTKRNADPTQGLAGLRQARAATRMQLVAIGGITPENAPEVLTAGADAVAMIGALAAAGDPGAIIRALG